MERKRCGSQPSGTGPEAYFTGTVRMDPLFQAPDPARARGACVTCEPGAHGLASPSARPAWTCHVRLRLGAVVGRPQEGHPAR